jgi:outer membrane protein assembly factor BamA
MTLLPLAALLLEALAFQPAPSRLVVVRVHGNHTVPDEEVLTLAGLSVGQPFTPEDRAAIEKCLLESGKFASVEVRVRYRGLRESADVALVLLVREKPTLESRFLAGPIFDLTDEYGLTLGGRLAFVDVGVEGGRIAFPLSWGGKRQLGAEGTLPLGRNGSARFALSRYREVHPHYDTADNRWTAGGGYRIERGLLGIDVSGKWSDVEFGTIDERFAELGGRASLDSRRDPTIPGDAFYVSFDWRRLFFLAASDRPAVDQSIVDLRGYKRLFGQVLLASQAYWAVADGTLPPYEQPFLGGGRTLRGHAPGEYAGDNAALPCAGGGARLLRHGRRLRRGREPAPGEVSQRSRLRRILPHRDDRHPRRPGIQPGRRNTLSRGVERQVLTA